MANAWLLSLPVGYLPAGYWASGGGAQTPMAPLIVTSRSAAGDGALLAASGDGASMADAGDNATGSGGVG